MTPRKVPSPPRITLSGPLKPSRAAIRALVEMLASCPREMGQEEAPEPKAAKTESMAEMMARLASRAFK
jgi:hypothetical protein